MLTLLAVFKQHFLPIAAIYKCCIAYYAITTVDFIYFSAPRADVYSMLISFMQPLESPFVLYSNIAYLRASISSINSIPCILKFVKESRTSKLQQWKSEDTWQCTIYQHICVANHSTIFPFYRKKKKNLFSQFPPLLAFCFTLRESRSYFPKRGEETQLSGSSVHAQVQIHPWNFRSSKPKANSCVGTINSLFSSPPSPAFYALQSFSTSLMRDYLFKLPHQVKCLANSCVRENGVAIKKIIKER